MTIRKAVDADIPGIVTMSAKFYRTTSYAGFTPMDDETVAVLTGMLIESGVVLVEDAGDRLLGVVALYVGPFMFNKHSTSAHEVVWWVEEDARGLGTGKSFLIGIEHACREKGCSIVQMVTLASSPEHAGKVYESLGYTHSETSYTKVLI